MERSQKTIAIGIAFDNRLKVYWAYHFPSALFLMFKTIVDPKASKEMEKLPAELQKQISQKMDQATENPKHFFKKLNNRTDYKLRVGTYRVIADIDFFEQKITITFIGHRKNVYEKI